MVVLTLALMLDSITYHLAARLDHEGSPCLFGSARITTHHATVAALCYCCCAGAGGDWMLQNLLTLDDTVTLPDTVAHFHLWLAGYSACVRVAIG
ncbi:hypothetical protein QC764_0068780 [Podospora pseudoanserina]|uniref:Uncharacterized protein n=1 Tax=Podospora pseudoanserina TaxID=2609844 RepID=A0ABR0IA85_9PEZI|nr:hypothetical protein QC764_0068780 [Podospora pseudoanserina]